MFNVILVVIAVSNGRFYDEKVMYTVEYPTEEACYTAQRAYPTKGVFYNKAVCVPKVELKK